MNVSLGGYRAPGGAKGVGAMHLDLNLKQLKVFYYAAKHLSLTRAAEELYVTQPAVAMQLKSLEAHLQTPLFHRKNNRLELTEAGSLLFGYAERMVHIALEAEQALIDLRQTTGTMLRVGTTKTLARYLMPSYIPHFREQHPEIHIQLGDGNSKELMQSVLAGRIDLAIVGRVPYDPEVDFLPFPGHEADELLLIVAPDHPLAGKESVRLAKVSGESFILLPRGSGTRQTVERAAAERGVHLRVLLEAGSPDFIKDLIERHVGLSILSQVSIDEEVRRGTLAGVHFSDGGLYVNLDILLPKDRIRRPAVSAFLGFLEQRSPELGAGARARRRLTSAESPIVTSRSPS